MVMDWRRMFEPQILKRGEDYWQDGCVDELSEEENAVTAVVSGTNDYEVEIEINRKGNIEFMSCTCPYAEKGSNCKHMAAVLFAMDAEGLMPSDTHRNSGQISDLPWQAALSQLSPEEMRQLLSQWAQFDRKLQEQIAILHGQPASEALQTTWEMQLAEIQEEYTDCDDYISYDHAYDFYMELTDFLDTRLPQLLKTKSLTEAFALSCMVFETGMAQDADDSDGGCGVLAGACEEVWRQLLELADPQQEQQIHNWLASHIHAPEWNYGSEVAEQFLFDWEWSTPLLEQNLRLLDMELVKEDPAKYRMTELLSWRAGTMAALGMGQGEVDRFWAQYRHLPFAREREISRMMDEKDYDGAIKVLKESKELDEKDAFLVQDHSQKLIALYQQTGRTEELREELRFQIFSCVQRDLTYIKMYREIISPEQWPALLEELLRSVMTRSLKYELLAFGEEYEQLYSAIMQEGSFHRLNRYADILCRRSPELVRDTYVQMLDGVMSRSSDRNMYRDAIGYLQRVRQFPNGAAAAKQLVDSWRVKFGRRRAMLDELDKAGY